MKSYDIVLDMCCDVAYTIDKLGLYSKITFKQLKECLQAAGIIDEK